MAPLAAIFGCEGAELSPAEHEFFTRTQPAGFILFSRNCESKEQIKALVADLKSCVSHDVVPILIDQEGGRVARLKPPLWRSYPPAWHFVEMAAHDTEMAARACYLNARLIAHDLAELGINTDCAPVADLRLQGAHDVIGDRAFGYEAATLVPLARAQAQGLMDGGIMPVLKHIPGHGRALVDSHHDLPVVNEPLDVLRATDFVPFKALADLPMAMTAHIRYQAIDAKRPATLSPDAISLIRSDIGFDGWLMTDDMSMKALSGEIGALSAQALAAGCDVVLHCNGQMDEMQAIASAIGGMNTKATARLKKAALSVAATPKTDVHAALAELAELQPALYAA